MSLTLTESVSFLLFCFTVFPPRLQHIVLFVFQPVFKKKPEVTVELLNQFKAIEKMSNKDKGVVKVFLDAFITKKKLKQLI